MKKIRQSIVILLSLFAAYQVHGQHDPLFRNYFLHQQIINPAISGSEFFPVVNASYIKQWAGISQSPSVQMISGSFRIGNFDFYNPKMYVNKTSLKAAERIGAGFVVFNDNQGPVSHRGAQMSYAFHVPMDRARISFGLSAGYYQHMIDERDFSPVFPNDPILHFGTESYAHFNAGTGVYYYSPNWFAGASVTDLVPLRLEDLDNQRIRQDLHLNGGYMIDPGDRVKFEPSVYLALYNYEALYYQVNARIYMDHVHWMNFHYRSIGTIGIQAAVKISRFHIAYGYEANLSRIFLYNMGTHEINIGTNLGIRRLEGF